MSRIPDNARVRSKDVFGILEWFHFEDYDFVEQTLADLSQLGVKHLRTGISWADWMRYALDGVSEVFHFAGQTAVTTSLDDPIGDFTTNARGTLNLLEEMRRRDKPGPHFNE